MVTFLILNMLPELRHLSAPHLPPVDLRGSASQPNERIISKRRLETLSLAVYEVAGRRQIPALATPTP